MNSNRLFSKVLTPLQKYSQVFLSNADCIASIVDQVKSTCKSVFEVGPGGGALIPYFMDKHLQYHALEKDPRSVGFLKEQYGLEVTNGDFLTDPITIKADLFFSSVPYSIIRPFMRKLIEISPQFQDFLLILPVGFANRLGKGATDKKNLYSFLLERYFEMTMLIEIPAEDFTPVPKVDSCLMRFTKKQGVDHQLEAYFEYLNTAFLYPRKKLAVVFPEAPAPLKEKRAHQLTIDEHIFLYEWHQSQAEKQ